MRAVICSTSAWRSSSRVGTHHLASHLLRRGWDVEWFSAPIGPLHLAALHRHDVRARLRTWLFPVVDGRLRARTPFSLLATGGDLRRWSARRIARWPRWTLPRLVPRLRRARGVDLLFVDSPLYAEASLEVDASVSVYRITDYTPGFPGMTPLLLAAEQRAVGEADLVMVPVPALATYARSIGARRVTVIPNGVDAAAFNGRPASPALQGITRPIAIYIGSLRAWFDVSLVEALSESRPDLSIVIVGPTDDAVARLRRSPNLHLLGPADHDEVPALLAGADVGLIPFDVVGHADLVKDVDPIKLYEYCAAGLPVVAMRWPALEDRGSPALLADDQEEFVERVGEALRRRDELGEAGLRFASDSDWARRFELLLSEAGISRSSAAEADR